MSPPAVAPEPLAGRARARRHLAVVLVVVAAHAYGLAAFGATFWIDSRDYVALAIALAGGGDGGLAGYYADSGRWIFGHLQPGASLVWLATGLLPDAWRWPVLAIAQHAAAAVALVYAHRTVDTLWPSAAHGIAIGLLLLLPAYQAFHAAPLTESAASTLLLAGFAASLRIAYLDRPPRRDLLVGLAVVLAITQFRSYWGVAVTAMLAIALAARGRALQRWTVPLGAVALSAALAFPAWRWVGTGEFFLPSGGLNVLIAGLQVNPNPSAQARAAFDPAWFPPALQPATLFAGGLDADGAIALARHWREAGLDDRAIAARAEALGAALRADGAGVLANRIVYGLASLGSIEVYRIGDPRREVFRGYDMARMHAHQTFYWRWHGWVSDADYPKWFRIFFVEPAAEPFPNERAAKAELRAALEARVDATARLPRDPLGLGTLPPDPWPIAALAGLAVLAARARAAMLMVGVAVGLAFATAFWFPLGNTRYANPLFPVYALTASIALGILGRAWRTRTGRDGLPSREER